jgi:hypothetical protein
VREYKIFYKIYPRIRKFGSEFIQVPKNAHTGDSFENHKQAKSISETVMEKRLPLFPSLSSSLRHFSAARSCVFTKRSPTSNHSFYLAVIQYLLMFSKDQRPLFQTYCPKLKITTQHSLFQLFFSEAYISSRGLFSLGVQLRQ